MSCPIPLKENGSAEWRPSLPLSHTAAKARCRVTTIFFPTREVSESLRSERPFTHNLMLEQVVNDERALAGGYLFVAKCSDGSLYIGFGGNLENSLRDINLG